MYFSRLILHTFCWRFFLSPLNNSNSIQLERKKTIKRRDRDIHNTPISSSLIIWCLSAVFTLKTLLTFEWKIEPFNFLFRLVWCVLFSLSDIAWMGLFFFHCLVAFVLVNGFTFLGTQTNFENSLRSKNVDYIHIHQLKCISVLASYQ